MENGIKLTLEERYRAHCSEFLTAIFAFNEEYKRLGTKRGVRIRINVRYDLQSSSSSKYIMIIDCLHNNIVARADFCPHSVPKLLERYLYLQDDLHLYGKGESI